MSLLITAAIDPKGGARIPTPREALMNDIGNLRRGLLYVQQQVLAELIAELDRIAAAIPPDPSEAPDAPVAV